MRTKFLSLLLVAGALGCGKPKPAIYSANDASCPNGKICQGYPVEAVLLEPEGSIISIMDDGRRVFSISASGKLRYVTPFGDVISAQVDTKTVTLTGKATHP